MPDVRLPRLLREGWRGALVACCMLFVGHTEHSRRNPSHHETKHSYLFQRAERDFHFTATALKTSVESCRYNRPRRVGSFYGCHCEVSGLGCARGIFIGCISHLTANQIETGALWLWPSKTGLLLSTRDTPVGPLAEQRFRAEGTKILL